MTEMKPTEKFPQVVRLLLRVVAGLSLLYYAWMMLDLVTHPFSPGSNAGSIPYLFRWLSAACGTYTTVVAVFILRRVPGNTMGFLLLFFGVGAAGWSQRIDFGSPQATALVLILFTLYFFSISLPALTALLFHFPSGQIYPARLSGWAWGLVALQGLAGILSNLGVPAYQNGLVPNPVYIPALLPFAGLLNWSAVVIAPLAGVISLALRFRAGGVRERMQIKWLVWLAAIAMAFSVLVAVAFPVITTGQGNNPVNQLANIIVFLYWQLFPAAAIGIALLRYRLWDIDLIIRRTLLYALLSGLLGLVYFGSVLLLRQVLGGLTGESSAALVISTLLIAALFSPLRRRLQAVIDQRFFRSRYNAEHALARFSQNLRDQVDLPSIEDELVRVVGETVQPVQATLWLRPLEKK